ncbi:KR domain-containing protein, partial [Streptomyces sp. NPDC058000]|uniref:KR domain-containing protein n=1 Tax=Streptomyces sp. NPDC058000 TaxID=3346299 RepID=UPI0036E94438
QLTTTLHPKITATHHLHHLTQNHPLTHFILFSSIAGTIGNAGQANYAAANTYLDALAQHRRARGLPATSLAWGLWGESGMGAALEGAELARMRRIGVVAMAPDEALRLFDEALGSERPLLVPARIDTAALRSGSGPVPSVLRDLVRGAVGAVPSAGARKASGGGQAPGGRDTGNGGGAGATPAELLAGRLVGHDAEEQREVTLDLVRSAIAGVLGRGEPAAVPEDRGLLDLGFDSLTAVELRNRLSVETGLRLSTTLVFDYPTAGALAAHLRDELAPAVAALAVPGTGEPSDATVLAQLDLIEASLPALAGDAPARTAVADRLRAVLRQLGSGAEAGAGTTVADPGSPGSPGDPVDLDGVLGALGANGTVGADGLDAATDDEIFRLIDTELGTE